LLRCVTITIFELDRHLCDDFVGNQKPETSGISENLSDPEIAIVRILSDVLAGMLNALLMPVYTMKQVFIKPFYSSMASGENSVGRKIYE
jgi:hypothetical protein